MFYFHSYFGKIPSLTNIFQRGWNHQPGTYPSFPQMDLTRKRFWGLGDSGLRDRHSRHGTQHLWRGAFHDRSGRRFLFWDSLQGGPKIPVTVQLGLKLGNWIKLGYNSFKLGFLLFPQASKFLRFICPMWCNYSSYYNWHTGVFKIIVPRSRFVLLVYP